MTSVTGTTQTITPPPIGNVGENTGFSEGVAPSGGTGGTSDKDMFLKLLVAQMKYQDPSKPTDSSQLLSQTAQFSLVEKMDQLADSYASALQSSELQAATGMLGSTVNWTTADNTAKSGVVSGVTIKGGVPTLMVGTQAVALSAVTQVTKTSATS